MKKPTVAELEDVFEWLSESMPQSDAITFGRLFGAREMLKAVLGFDDLDSVKQRLLYNAFRSSLT